MPRAPDVAEVDALLPQTQCRRCDYPDCRSYARAVAQEGAAINRCPPGGMETLARLAALTGRPELALDPECGQEAPRRVAVVEEAWCIGCTLCIQACPVDAIIGAAKRMHTVIERMCTGCELCIPPCPVDCIVLEPPRSGPVTPAAWLAERAGTSRRRYEARQERLAVPGRRVGIRGRADGGEAADRRRAIAAAVARVRARRAREGMP